MTNILTDNVQTRVKAKLLFLTYVRTRQLINSRLKENEVNTPAYISQKEIEKRFFVYPENDRKICLAELVEAGQLKIHKDNKFFTYESLVDGNIDLSLIKPHRDNFNNPLISSIRNDLKHVTLSENSLSTEYFDAFLKYKDEYLNLFFTVDNFSKRIHTPVSNFHREYRGNILFYGEEIASLDVATMQPLLLGKILTEAIGENEYSDWINEGEDIYLMLMDKANLKTRDEAKKRLFEILFAKPSDELKDMFGGSKWIDWINNYKRSIVPANPHNKEKPHSNLAWLLQTTEVKIMHEVWLELYDAEIPFLTIHDEIIVRQQDGTQAERLFSQVLDSSFEYYKLNSKIDSETDLIKKENEEHRNEELRDEIAEVENRIEKHKATRFARLSQIEKLQRKFVEIAKTKDVKDYVNSWIDTDKLSEPEKQKLIKYYCE